LKKQVVYFVHYHRYLIFYARMEVDAFPLIGMSDHRSDVFLVMTANNISKLPPELTRSGRTDGVFFVDMPTAEQRKAIWKIHKAKYGHAADAATPPDHYWTGADIEQCCRLAVIWNESLVESGARVVPTYHRYKDSLESVRQWAHGTTLDAETALPYVYNANRASADADAYAQLEAARFETPRARKIGKSVKKKDE
jgi:SpoVK/Ycf46/Vps4 family AAA+-type ATPase